MCDVFSIEKVLDDDLEVLQKEEINHFENPWSLQSYKEELIHPGSRIKKAVFKSRICGFAVSRLILEEMHILKICILKEFQRKNIGSALLDSLIEELKTQITQVLLEVRENNSTALSFYKKNGFKVVGKRKNYYGQGVHALNMTKDLSGGNK
ncbi:MAG: ribosomal protein S18-alanine N-acetyltransferase [Desulforegulaceae bacterium]|nr:ribosomal protein S18-alanine N-acetyltransferase [Desulforegulaceae bacterium]